MTVSSAFWALIAHDWDWVHLHLDRKELWLTLGIVVAALTFHVVLRRRRYAFRALRAIDAALFWTTIAFWMGIVHYMVRADLYLVLAFLLLIILTRAVVVPSSGRRTFWRKQA